MNYDAALFEGERVTGMGCVLRNSQGVFLGCFVNKMCGVLSAKDA